MSERTAFLTALRETLRQIPIVGARSGWPTGSDDELRAHVASLTHSYYQMSDMDRQWVTCFVQAAIDHADSWSNGFMKAPTAESSPDLKAVPTPINDWGWGARRVDWRGGTPPGKDMNSRGWHTDTGDSIALEDTQELAIPATGDPESRTRCSESPMTEFRWRWSKGLAAVAIMLTALMMAALLPESPQGSPLNDLVWTEDIDVLTIDDGAGPIRIYVEREGVKWLDLKQRRVTASHFDSIELILPTKPPMRMKVERR